ncbi:ATP-binding protein [Candidatus Margulisiibacteriota bacterium]
MGIASVFTFTAYTNSIISLLIGVFVLFANSKQKQNITYFFFSLSLCLYATFFALSLYNPDPVEALLQVRIFHVFCFFIAAFMYLFTHEVIFKNVFTKPWHFIPILIAVIGSYFALFGTIVKGVEPVGIITNWTVVGKQFWIYLIPYLLFTHGSLVISLFHYFKATGIRKQQIKWVFISLLIGLTGAWTTFLPAWGVKIEPHGFHFIFLLHFAIGFSILKFQLFNLKATLSRFGSFLVTTLVWGITCFYIFYFYFWLTGQRMDIDMIVISLCIGLVAGLSFEKLSIFLQTSAEKAFIKGWYNFDKTVQQFSARLEPVYSYKNAFDVVRTCLSEIEMSKVTTVEPIIKNNETINYLIKKGDETHEIFPDNPLIYYFRQHREFKKFNDFNNIIKDDINRNDYLKGIIYLPLYSGKELAGMIILGKKDSGRKFDEKDLTLFSTFESQLSIVFDRIKPYEKIKTEYQKTLDIAEQYAQQAAFATLTKGIAHEIRNPLGALKAGAFIVQKDPQNTSEVVSYANTAREVVDRLINLTESMLKYGSAVSKEKEYYSTKTILDEVLTLLELERDKKHIKINIDHRFEKNIFCDPGSINHVFLNIILNAFQAMDDKGEINILVEDSSFLNKDGIRKDCALIKIQDNGKGMTEETIKEIFNPFYSTKYQNAGLGLAIVLKIIEAHEGIINVESEVGKGSAFFIYLPSSVA